jgi:hypothetical protein
MTIQLQHQMPKRTPLVLLAVTAICALAPTANAANGSITARALTRPAVMPTGTYAHVHPRAHVLRATAIRCASRSQARCVSL